MNDTALSRAQRIFKPIFRFTRIGGLSSRQKIMNDRSITSLLLGQRYGRAVDLGG